MTDPDGRPPAQGAVERGLTVARATVIIPVVVLILAALGAFAYGAYTFGDSARQIVDAPSPVGHKIGLFLVVVDLFLIGATLLIAAIGFYELFLRRPGAGTSTHVPPWLQIDDLGDLKARVIAMVVLVASVRFIETVVNDEHSTRILEDGIGIAVVIVALTAFLRLGESSRGAS